MSGWCRFGPCLLVSFSILPFAVVCTWYAGRDCHFFEVQYDGTPVMERPATPDANRTGDLPWMGMGIWTVEEIDPAFVNEGNECVRWSDHSVLGDEDVIDAGLIAARTASLLAALCGTASVLAVSYISVFAHPAKYKVMLSRMFFVMAPWMLLFFTSRANSVCRDSEKCRLGSAGVVCLAGMALWLILGRSALQWRKTLSSDRLSRAQTAQGDETAEVATVPTSTAASTIDPPLQGANSPLPILREQPKTHLDPGPAEAA